MRILLTGAAGFIGSTLAEKLVARGDEVVGLDLLDETLYPAQTKRQHLAALVHQPGFRLVTGDLADPETVQNLFTPGLDAVVHLGALAGVRTSIEMPLRYHRTNASGTLGLLDAARRTGVGRFINVSTSSVYDPLPRDRTPRPLRETDPTLRPASPYGATKRAAELYCSNFGDVYGFRTTSLRLFSVYGPRQRPDMAIHRFTRAMLQGQPIHLFGDGSSMRDYTYVDDVVNGLIAALDTADQGPVHRVFNLGGGQTTTLARLVALLEQALGVRARIEHRPEQAGDAFATLADISLARQELAFHPAVTLEDGIERFVRWFQSTPEATQAV